MYSKVIIAISVFLVMIMPVYAELSCELTTDCAYTDILHLSDTIDAHAELPSYNSYPLKVCCRDTTDVVTLSSSCDGYTFLHLSDTQDAQAEKNTQNNLYTDACVAADVGFINCDYQASCDQWETCLLSISDDTDAHLAECGSYDTNLCCSLSYSNAAPTISSLHVQEQVAKFGTLRIYCNGTDQDDVNDGMDAYVFLKVSGAPDWNRLDNASMEYDGSYYYDYIVQDDGGTVYDAECHLSDGYEIATKTQTSIAEVIDDWDGDGVSDSEDGFEGSGDDLDTDTGITIEIDGVVQTNPTGKQTVEFKDSSTSLPLITFDFDFSADKLELPNIKIRIDDTGRGSMLIQGLSGINKTVNVPKVLGLGKICIKDQEIEFIDEISAECTGPNEYLFNTCDGEVISGITCTDKGDYFEVAGLMNSAVKEFGETKLSIWAEGNIRLAPTMFYANYSNATSGQPITGADCSIRFNDTSWLNMSYGSGFYNYSRTYTASSLIEYTVNCSHISFDSLELNDTHFILGSAIPEFNIFTLLIALIATTSVIIIQRRNRK